MRTKSTRPLATLLGLATLLAGCGPMARPMAVRLQPEEQAQVDEAWENMLTPPDRLDRLLFLDTVLSGQLYQIGTDRLYFGSEKRLRDGVVTMEVFFDRRSPEADRFTIRYVNGRGQQELYETYSRQEVDDRFEFLFPVLAERRDTGDDTAELSKGECEAHVAKLKAERQARMKEIEAATQPSTRDTSASADELLPPTSVGGEQ